jgi:hypothetical protein
LDLNNIQNVSRILQLNKNESEADQYLNIQTKRPSGKNSIYVEALQAISATKKVDPYRLSKLNFQDRITGKYIRPSTMLEAHITCKDEILKLPRFIDKNDKNVKFDGEFFNLFQKQYKTVFGYNLLREEDVSMTDNKNKIKRAEKRLYKRYRENAKEMLRNRLFENPFVIKTKECRYRSRVGYVTIYYDFLSDLFGVVDLNSNRLLEFSVAIEIDYTDIFRYKSVLENKLMKF